MFMRGLALILMAIFPVFAISQSVFTNNTLITLQEVLGDYPNQFQNIRGELLRDDVETSDYSSKVEIPGSVHTVITRYRSSPDLSIYSWKSLLSESDDFGAISQRYKEFYKEIKNSIIKLDGQKPFILNGTYESPSESKKFSTSTFYLLPPTNELRKLRVELTIEFYVTEWKVFLLVYDEEEGAMVME